MPLALLFGNGIPWRLIGVVAGVILATACYFEMAHISHLESQLNAVSRVANDNAVMAENARQSMDRANRIAAQVAMAAKAARGKFSATRRKVIDAPAHDDGPLAPVLRRVLDGLPGEDGDKVNARRSSPATGEFNNMPRWP